MERTLPVCNNRISGLWCRISFLINKREWKVFYPQIIFGHFISFHVYPSPYMYICFILCIYIFLFGYTHAIQNGTEVQDWNQYPFYTAIGNPRLCGGAFLSFNPTWVLTAAHCVVNTSTTPSSKNGYYIMYGNMTRSGSHIAPIESWIIHPQYAYNNSDVEHDLAVIKVPNNSIIASSGVSRIPLLSNAASIQIGQQSWVMGYGFTSVGGNESTQLRAINESISYVDSDSLNLIRANTAPYSGVCHGDSGKVIFGFSFPLLRPCQFKVYLC